MTKRMISVPVGTPKMRATHFGRGTQPVITNRVSVYPDGTRVEELIKTLQEINDQLGKEYTNLSVESEIDCGCYHECRCSLSYYVWEHARKRIWNTTSACRKNSASKTNKKLVTSRLTKNSRSGLEITHEIQLSQESRISHPLVRGPFYSCGLHGIWLPSRHRNHRDRALVRSSIFRL